MSLVTLFCLASAVGWALFLYPYAIYPLVLRAFRHKPVARGTGDLGVSLLFCAYNEAESLPDKIENLRQLKRHFPKLEILAYDDSSTDGTSDLLAAAADIVTVVQGAGRTGKAAGMKQLAARASGEVLMFTDANVILAPDAIEKLLPYYADPEVGGVCGTLLYTSDPGSTTAEVGSLYWRLDEYLRLLESASGNVMGADGSVFSVRKSLYPEFPDTVLDDLTVSMSVIFAGKRLIKAADVLAYEKSVAQRDEEVRRKVRIGARAFHTHLYMRPKLRKMPALDRFKYFSRKVLRWFGGALLIAGGVFALAALVLISHLAAIVAVLGGAAFLALVLRARGGALAKVGEIVVSIFATQLGVWKGMRGQTVVTWAPAKSR